VSDALKFIDRQFARLVQISDDISDMNHRAFVRAFCDAGTKVNSQEGKLAVYVLAAAAMAGPEGLQDCLGLVGELMAEETEGI